MFNRPFLHHFHIRRKCAEIKKTKQKRNPFLSPTLVSEQGNIPPIAAYFHERLERRHYFYHGVINSFIICFRDIYA